MWTGRYTGYGSTRMTSTMPVCSSILTITKTIKTIIVIKLSIIAITIVMVGRVCGALASGTKNMLTPMQAFTGDWSAVSPKIAVTTC